MAPDLNSLPPSRSVSISASSNMTRTISGSSGELTQARGQSPTPSSRSPSTSLQAAAAVNAGLQHEGSRRSSISSNPRNWQASHAGRRRSTVLMNLQLNDPTLPPSAEIVSEGQPSVFRTASPQPIAGSPTSVMMSDPRHFRTPSLGDIHQELEQEQEAQVNRLLQMIRTQQQHLQQLQASAGGSHGTPPVIDESTPTSEHSMSFSNPHNIPMSTSTPRSPSALVHPRSSFDLARADLHRRSRTPSRTASPRLRSTSISGEGEPFSLGGRDESAFYQAETQMMIRENQMLRQRIRELERQVTELHVNSSITHEPATPSHLLRSESVSEEPLPRVPEQLVATISTEAKEV